MPQIENPDLRSIANHPFFLVCMTLSIMEIARQIHRLIYQALHLAKLLPFTDTSMKMGPLSVNGLLEKWRLRTKWAKMAVCL